MFVSHSLRSIEKTDESRLTEIELNVKSIESASYTALAKNYYEVAKGALEAHTARRLINFAVGSMNKLGVLILILDWRLVHHRMPSIK